MFFFSFKMVDHRELLTIGKTSGIVSEITKYIFLEWGMKGDAAVAQPYYFSRCAAYVKSLNVSDAVGVVLTSSVKANLENAIAKLQEKFPYLRRSGLNLQSSA